MSEPADLDGQTDEELESLNSRAKGNLASGKQELSDLVEKGLSQPDERVIALREKNRHNQHLVDETERIQKQREQKKDKE